MLEAYTFAFKIIPGGTPSPREYFEGEVKAFVDNHKDAKVQSCSMTTAMYETEQEALTGNAGMLFGVIFYETTT